MSAAGTHGTTTVQGYPSLGFNPAPGSPSSVSTLAEEVNETYRKLKATDDLMSGVMKGVGGWTGIAADSFTMQVKDLPGLLATATSSFHQASAALGDWQQQLTAMKCLAEDCEARASRARSQVRNAEENPVLSLANQEFSSESEASDAQRRLDTAVRSLEDARRDLNAIIEEAKDLQTRHDETADDIARLVQRACEKAPDEPGLWDRLLDWVETNVEIQADFANRVWDWTKEHAENIANIGDVLATASTVLGVAGFGLVAAGAAVAPFFPPAGAVLMAAGEGMEMVSGGLAGGALLFHGVAKMAGADVPTRSLIEDGLGTLSFATGGASTLASGRALNLIEDAGRLMGRGSAGSGGQGMTQDASALEYFAPKGIRQAVEYSIPGGALMVGMENAWNAGDKE